MELHSCAALPTVTNAGLAENGTKRGKRPEAFIFPGGRGDISDKQKLSGEKGDQSRGMETGTQVSE